MILIMSKAHNRTRRDLLAQSVFYMMDISWLW